ncbi:MAG: YbjQ family protein [Phycisphaerae bacterium]|nr:YbjQ family protein [Phycisphaerae bacterium]
MLVTTSENIAGFRIVETKGQVFGVVVRSRGAVGNIMAGLRSVVGGEIKEYTQMLEEARRHAVDRMVKNAQVMGANAVIMMRFDSSEMGQTMSEVVAYGTAVTAEAAG